MNFYRHLPNKALLRTSKFLRPRALALHFHRSMSCRPSHQVRKKFMFFFLLLPLFLGDCFYFLLSPRSTIGYECYIRLILQNMTILELTIKIGQASIISSSFFFFFFLINKQKIVLQRGAKIVTHRITV